MKRCRFCGLTDRDVDQYRYCTAHGGRPGNESWWPKSRPPGVPDENFDGRASDSDYTEIP